MPQDEHQFLSLSFFFRKGENHDESYAFYFRIYKTLIKPSVITAFY